MHEEPRIIKHRAQKKVTRKEIKTPLGNKTKVHVLYNPHGRKDHCKDCTSVVKRFELRAEFSLVPCPGVLVHTAKAPVSNAPGDYFHQA